MAANVFGQYTRVTVSWNGQILFQEASVNLKAASNAQQVKTVLLGFSGMTVGAAMVSGSVSNALPSSGFELDANPWVNGVVSGKITLTIGDPSTLIQTFTTNAWITEYDLSHATDANTKYDFTFVGAAFTVDHRVNNVKSSYQLRNHNNQI